MKRYLTFAPIAILLLFVSTVGLASNGDEKETFHMLSTKLDRAIEARNFHDAREALEDLLPLMKEELKKNRKELSSLKKEESPEIDPKNFESQIAKKAALYNSLKDLVEVSPAALRVKASKIKDDVDVFIKLS